MSLIMDTRRLLQSVRDKAARVGLQPSDVRAFTLKVYAKLNDKSNTYTFRFDATNKVCPTECLLETNDAFYSSSVGLMLHPVTVEGGVEYPANSPLVAYPDPGIFAGPAVASGVLTEAQCLEALYNATLEIKKDKDARLDSFATNVFRHVPQTQKGANTLPQMIGVDTIGIGSNFEFIGGRNNHAILSLASEGIDFSAVAGVAGERQNYVVLVAQGYLVKNGAAKPELINAGRFKK